MLIGSLGAGMYGPLNYRTAARTLFLRPYLAHFCSFFRRFSAVFSVLAPGFQKVAPKDSGRVPQRSKTAEERVVAADLFLVDRYTLTGDGKKMRLMETGDDGLVRSSIRHHAVAQLPSA